MSNYLRPRISGATVFFTVALARRGGALLVEEIVALRRAVRMTQSERPFHIDAWVVLPDHLHAVWTLPAGDRDYGTRWGAIKTRFVRGLPGADLRASHRRRRERGIWQRRFWEHHIRNAEDHDTHVRYCWGNPVRHGLVKCAADWPYSSIHRDIRDGRADAQWSCECPEGDFGE